MPTAVVTACLERRLLVNATHGHVIRLLPALTISDDEIDEGCAILADVLRQTACMRLTRPLSRPPPPRPTPRHDAFGPSWPRSVPR